MRSHGSPEKGHREPALVVCGDAVAFWSAWARSMRRNLSIAPSTRVRSPVVNRSSTRPVTVAIARVAERSSMAAKGSWSQSWIAWSMKSE